MAMESFNSFKEQAVASVRDALRSMGVKDANISCEMPEGYDLAIPCFAFSKGLGMAPRDVADSILKNIRTGDLITSVIALNGYLNFNIRDDVLIKETLTTILRQRQCYGSHPSKGLKVNVEHTSTNPTGPIHVGRARNPIIGDTLARALSRCGYEVETEYYVNDVGKQVVILTWGVNNLGNIDYSDVERDKTDHRLVLNYRDANRMMEGDPNVSEEISEMLRRFEAGDAEVISKVRVTAESMIKGLNETLRRINVSLDRYTWESDFISDGSAKDVVERLKACKEAGQTEDGAWYVDLKDYGVQGKNTKFTFTRSDGTTLYTTRDLAYHMDKFKRSDIVIDVLGEDQKLGSKQLCSALSMLGVEKSPDAMFYSFVSLPEGKMSTRKGVVVYLDDLIDEATARAYEEIRSRRSDLSEERMNEIATMIGVGAIRYNIIRVQPEKQLTFKWEDALSFDGNSGPYLQYVHARACSMLAKAGEFEHDVDPNRLTDEFELKLAKALSKMGEVTRAAGEDKKVHLLPAYGHEVAAAFNKFYSAVPVLASEDCRDARLTLVECTKVVLSNVLECLGIGAPEEM